MGMAIFRTIGLTLVCSGAAPLPSGTGLLLTLTQLLHHTL